MRYHISWKNQINYRRINLDHGFQEVFIKWKKNILEGIHVKKFIQTHGGRSGSNSLSEGVTVSTAKLKYKEREDRNRGSFSLAI